MGGCQRGFGQDIDLFRAGGGVVEGFGQDMAHIRAEGWVIEEAWRAETWQQKQGRSMP